MSTREIRVRFQARLQVRRVWKTSNGKNEGENDETEKNEEHFKNGKEGIKHGGKATKEEKK
jgi:hypothetical protein